MNDAAWVDWMTAISGGRSRQTYAATFPSDRFYCLLDDLPLHLVRRSLRHSWTQDRIERALQWNDQCLITPAERPPAAVAPCGELLSGFALQGTIAWVPAEIGGSLRPFWLGPELGALSQALAGGEISPESIPVSARRLLERAGILICPTDASERRTTRERAIHKAAMMFREKGYAPIADLIHPFHVAALRRYYRCLIRSGAIQLGDNQSSRRYIAHNEPVARFFHHQIATTLNAIAGGPVKPSYVYFASYQSGAELKKHTDREQCEFSVTLCLDFSPEPENATPWPIKLDAPSGTVTVYQGIGDALAYRGTRLPHYRHPLAGGQSSTSIFFHYVAADFAGPLD